MWFGHVVKLIPLNCFSRYDLSNASSSQFYILIIWLLALSTFYGYFEYLLAFSIVWECGLNIILILRFVIFSKLCVVNFRLYNFLSLWQLVPSGRNSSYSFILLFLENVQILSS